MSRTSKHKRGQPIQLRQLDANTIVLKPAPAPKKNSWWVGLDRQRFTEKLREQQRRIESTEFGPRQVLITQRAGGQS